jgi:hypothetical protein
VGTPDACHPFQIFSVNSGLQILTECLQLLSSYI